MGRRSLPAWEGRSQGFWALPLGPRPPTQGPQTRRASVLKHQHPLKSGQAVLFPTGQGASCRVFLGLTSP